MSYEAHFEHADDVMAHLAVIVPEIPDAVLQAKYSGFAAVAAVTVYEIALKDILFEFAESQHPLLGVFTHSQWDRINGRIRLCHIKDDYLASFGGDYVVCFRDALDAATTKYLVEHGSDIVTSYSNLILWRHDFVHQARVSASATFEDVRKSYEAGKRVLACVHEALYA